MRECLILTPDDAHASGVTSLESDKLFMWVLGFVIGFVLRDLLLEFLIPDDPDEE